MLKKFTMLVSTIAFSASMVFGSGFSIYEQGAKASAMGGAFIAQANDVTAVFFNPAGITSQEGFQLGLGTTIIIPAFAFQGPANVDPNLYTEAKDLVFPPSTLYATYQINDKLTAGFGFYTLFGLGSEWDKEWPGRQLATDTHIQTFFLNPVVAYEVMDGLSLSAGFSYVISNVTLERSVWFGPRNVFGESLLDGNGSGMGFNLGAQFKATEDLTIGVIYRDNILLEFDDGDFSVDFPAVDPVTAAEIGVFFPNTKGSAEIELPTMIGFGVAYQFTDKLIAEFDWMQLGWSSYDELKIEFDKPVGGSTVSAVDRKWEDSASLRFGLQYSVDDNLDLRLGYLRDNKAVPDERVEPSLPEGDRNLYSIGFGYKLQNNLTIDGFYMLLTQDDRKITNSVEDFNGEYTGLSSLFGVSFQYGL